jgi:hypothetical protein
MTLSLTGLEQHCLIGSSVVHRFCHLSGARVQRHATTYQPGNHAYVSGNFFTGPRPVLVFGPDLVREA